MQYLLVIILLFYAVGVAATANGVKGDLELAASMTPSTMALNPRVKAIVLHALWFVVSISWPLLMFYCAVKYWAKNFRA